MTKPDPCTKDFAGLDIVRREVDTSYAALVSIGDETGRPTEATPDIKQMAGG